jgi:hypothetical protein
MFAGSRRAEQLSLRSQQRVVTTVEESVLKTEMTGLESQEEDTPKCILFFKPMSWLGQIRSHRRDESWSDSLWQTFFSTSMGAQFPVIVEKPIATCAYRKFQLVPLVMDLRIAHDRVGSSADPTLNGHLKYPNNLDQSLNDVTDDKIRKYRADYNNRPPSVVSFMTAIPSTSGRLHSEFVRLLFLQAHRETDRFFAASGVQLAQTNPSGQFHFRRAAFASMLKSRVGNILAKAEALRINLNLDGASIASKSHTHPSHSQTSRLLTSSLSLGVPVSRPTQCMRGA